MYFFGLLLLIACGIEIAQASPDNHLDLFARRNIHPDLERHTLPIGCD